MVFGGCDIGSLTAKAVVYDGKSVISSEVIKVRGRPPDSAREAMKLALEKAGLSFPDLKYTVATGYGRDMVDFADSTESEISCHARGAFAGDGRVRTVIDIGGQDAKAIKLNAQGGVERYIYNDKCATGTGRFLEVIAAALDLKIDDLGGISEKAAGNLSLSSQCVIFAETEIVSLLGAGADVPEIVRALHNSVAGRTASLARSIGVEDMVMFTGGVAKNRGVAIALSRILGRELLVPAADPQINGAYGAAVFASVKGA